VRACVEDSCHAAALGATVRRCRPSSTADRTALAPPHTVSLSTGPPAAVKNVSPPPTVIMNLRFTLHHENPASPGCGFPPLAKESQGGFSEQSRKRASRNGVVATRRHDGSSTEVLPTLIPSVDDCAVALARPVRSRAPRRIAAAIWRLPDWCGSRIGMG